MTYINILDNLLKNAFILYEYEYICNMKKINIVLSYKKHYNE